MLADILELEESQVLEKLNQRSSNDCLLRRQVEKEMADQVQQAVLEHGWQGIRILEDTKRVLDWLAEQFRPGQILVSLMSQYTPTDGVPPEIGRRVTRAEYRAASAYMKDCGICEGFLQERCAAREEYTPPFDLTGV